MNCVCENLNKKITQNIFLDCIKRLKNNKAHGDDHVMNGYIKSTSDKMIDVYIELFHMIVETGIIPDSWLVIYIKHIYKNKRDKLDPNNFKHIMILSCVSKLFTAILRDRLFNLKGGGGGGYGFLFRSEFFFSANTRVRIFYFFRAKREIFFQNLTLDYMTKTLNQIIFFPSTKIRIFFSATLGIRIFF